ncbi:TetR/AcrR family transcriptional regulator [Pasteurellaceae bacterium 22721_9_1]
MRQSEIDMAEQIFLATERLMAEGGLHNLSMHKIAKEAKISAGTIYLYFKSKDELLEQLARRIFTIFSQELAKDYDENKPYFEQYRIMWWNIWHHLTNNPILVKNMGQYWSLPSFVKVCSEQQNQGHWAVFCQKAIASEQICDLPIKVLFSLSLESAVNLVHAHIYFNQEFSESTLENVIERTWRAIQQ